MFTAMRTVKIIYLNCVTLLHIELDIKKILLLRSNISKLKNKLILEGLVVLTIHSFLL